MDEEHRRAAIDRAIDVLNEAVPAQPAYFGIVPTGLRGAVSHSVLRTWLDLAGRVTWDRETLTGTCFPSRRAIAKQAGVSVRTVSYHLSALVESGYLTVERRWRANGSQRSSLYTLRRIPAI